MLNIAVMISGGGTTLQHLIDLMAAGELPIRIVGVLSSKFDVLGLERAKKHQLLTAVIPWKYHQPDVHSFGTAITKQLEVWKPQLIVMAGFIHFYEVPATYAGRIINVHPALLPKHGGKGMYGIYVQEAALAAGDKETGCTVHYVDNQYDHGPVILQRRIPVRPGDDANTLMARVQAEERLALPAALRQLAATITAPD